LASPTPPKKNAGIKLRTQTYCPIVTHDAPHRHRTENLNGVSLMKSATRSAGSPFMTTDEAPLAFPVGGLAKRGFDITAAALALIAFSPIFLLIMALVKFSDRGPIFY